VKSRGLLLDIYNYLDDERRSHRSDRNDHHLRRRDESPPRKSHRHHRRRSSSTTSNEYSDREDVSSESSRKSFIYIHLSIYSLFY
jgi:hypothetical protein